MKPFQIGSVSCPNQLVAAPLAGISDLPFRLIARSCGAGLTVSEMISSNGLLQGNRSTRELLLTVPEERPVAFQLFGAEPEIMGEAAALLSELPIDLIDINMGCPVRKVVRKNAGAALLKDLPLAERILQSVTKRSRLPVTVKIRAGWGTETIVAGEFARMAEGAGAAAIVVHGRTARQMFTGPVRLDTIREVRDAVDIPVVGNGDVRSPAEAGQMIAATGCDAVMIGRGSLGNPWVFSPAGKAESPRERLGFLLEHIKLMERHLTPRQAETRSKNHAAWYARGLRGAAQFRKALYEAANMTEIETLIRNFFLSAWKEWSDTTDISEGNQLHKRCVAERM